MSLALDQFSEYIRALQTKNQGGLIALEGTWGSGKSYLLNSFIQEIEKNNDSIINGDDCQDKKYCYCIRFNAWEYNDVVNPFTALLEVVIRYLDDTLVRFREHKNQQDRSEKINNAAGRILEALSIPATLIPNVGSAIANGLKFASNLLQNQAKNVARGKNTPKTIEEAYSKAKEGLDDLSSSGNVILLIDDLDRCFPNIQLRLLESLHHICDGAKFITIVSLVPEQLETSLEKIYGNKMDINDYVSKVFNGRFILENSIAKMVKFEEIKQKYFSFRPNYQSQFQEFIVKFSKRKEFTMREIEKVKQIVEKVLTIIQEDDEYTSNRSCPLQLFLLACSYALGDKVLQYLVDNWPNYYNPPMDTRYSWFFDVIHSVIKYPKVPTFELSLNNEMCLDAIRSTVFVNLDQKI